MGSIAIHLTKLTECNFLNYFTLFCGAKRGNTMIAINAATSNTTNMTFIF